MPKNRAKLLALFADSVLVEKGFADADAVRSAILGLHPNFATLIPLEPTVACESWLRAPHAISSIPAIEHTGERSGKYWQLNPTGTRILRIFLDGGTRHQAAQDLSKGCGVSSERASADVDALLAALRAAKLVTA